jgi:hypothetical protein
MNKRRSKLRAAIALYRLTGEKAKQFSDGYPADPPARN